MVDRWALPRSYQMAQNFSQSESGSASGSSDQVPVTMDLNVALQRMDGDAELLQEIIDIFLDDHVGGLQELHAAAEARDSTRLQRAAHTLKGAAGNFVAVRATDLAFQLEQTCKGGDLDGGIALVRPLDQEIARLAAALRARRGREAA